MQKAERMSKGKGWYSPKVVTVDFTEIGRDDLYVKFLDPNSMAYGKTKELQEKYSTLNLDPENPDPAATDVMLGILIDLIVDWKMTNPDTDEPLERPTTPEEFRVLPMEILVKLFEASTTTMEAPGAPLVSEITPDPQPEESPSQPQNGS